MRTNILAIEKYLPMNRVSSEALDKHVNGVEGRIEKNTGVKFRHKASEEESVTEMGARALKKALNKSGMQIKDIDLLIYCGASYDYPVPHNSAIIKSKLTDDTVNFHCIDIDSTCLSFMNALDIAQLYIQAKRYRRIALVCAEIASAALGEKDEKVFGLFGDAAVALILEASESQGFHQKYIYFVNYTSGALFANVPIGGYINRGIFAAANDTGYHFKMNGKGMMKLIKSKFDVFIKEVQMATQLNLNDFDAIITHQASKFGNEFFKNTYMPNSNKVIETLAEYGNCISASIPLGLERLINAGFDTHNKKLLILGSGAGLSIGAQVLDFG
jgi:3-oxoacyl-[acyl-carrier-protein] synthase-3